MGWLNLYGFAIITIMMIPNIIYAKKCKDGFNNLWNNKIVEILEQIGRFGCFGFMIINIPHTYIGFWFNYGLPLYLSVNAVLLSAYCLIWIVCFYKNSIFRTLALSILPSLLFLFSGIVILSVPLIISSVIFAPCHILLSYKNTVLAKNSEQ